MAGKQAQARGSGEGKRWTIAQVVERLGQVRGRRPFLVLAVEGDAVQLILGAVREGSGGERWKREQWVGAGRDLGAVLETLFAEARRAA